MGKKGGAKKQPITPTLSQSSVSLREERTGKIQNKGASRNPKSLLKLEHLQKLAVWASGEASIPSLGAFFGRQFAVAREILGVSPDPSIILCQRCETILQPGFNCTVRIERTQTKARRRQKKSNTPMQNNVVYKCHFCSHQNLKRGTPKGHMKEICPPKPKPKPSAKSEPFKSMAQKSASLEKVTKSKDEIALPSPSGDPSVLNSPATPLVRSGATLLDAKRRKRTRSGSKSSEQSESNNAAEAGERTFGASSKRKRKSWTSLKEIAESNEHDSTRNITNLTVPFFI
ncbi:hypothetical protein P3X46_016724 [Hevea brasiliensis]|uniref:RNAse P Rpr2/Rpp21 subunit domain protein n=1 Tax=Hevea brasiliensis TaxID=3981 RepID=A0ABQ9M280_HEVBR|nr:uncharacterized protein LOC110658517 [Hevea brasiliensis]KAJ9173607.1 hypothetical protein P3X46_016724 [Hevea brasiliensis]